jgi:bifunctional DNase/RNase
VKADGKTQAVDARPSDALVLALRVKAPIFVAAEVLEAEGVRVEALPEKLDAGTRRGCEHEPPTEEESELEWRSVPPPELPAWPAPAK